MSCTPGYLSPNLEGDERHRTIIACPTLERYGRPFTHLAQAPKDIRMKIICLEEHAMDPELAKASHQAQTQEAPYMADLGSRTKSRSSAVGEDRPRLRTMSDIMPLAHDLGEGRIADMDANGIDMQVLSYSNASQLVPGDGAVDLTRAANDRLAAAVHANPARFAAFATLPWGKPDAAARELERAVVELGLKGALLTGRPGATFLDDPRYEPVLAKLAELRVPLYVHPGPPLPQVREPYYGGFDKDLSARLSLFGWGWHNEAGIHVIRLILSGLLDRYRDLQFISGHWGEMVPFYLQRMDDAMPSEVTGLSRSIGETYRQHVHVTPSGMLNLPHFTFIKDVIGIDRIMFSVDYPYLTNIGARRFLEALPIGDDDKAKIAHRNAQELLRL